MSILLNLTPLILFLPFSLISAHPCSDGFLREIANLNVTGSCRQKLLGAEFGWSFDRRSSQLDFAFGSRIESKTGWLAWGINPDAPHMVGTRALIGVRLENGSLAKNVYSLTSYTKRGCRLRPEAGAGAGAGVGDLRVMAFEFEYLEQIEYFVIRAKVELPSSRTHMVWQVGESADGIEPRMHPTTLRNLASAETFDFAADRILTNSAHFRRSRVRVHGILNMVGWGTLLSIGAIIARYFRAYPKQSQLWFKFHVGCQILGYLVGSAGWAIGLWLGKTSTNYSFHTHGILGTIIFTFSTVQMLALCLKTEGKDKYRMYWNMYHHCLGYVLLVLIWVNIYLGVLILEQVHAWKWAYIGLLALLGAVVAAMELWTWAKFIWNCT